MVPSPASPRPDGPEIAQHLQQLLEAMHDVPALVMHRSMHVLAWNRGAVALLTDFGALPPDERNLIRLTFLDNGFRALYADWATVARECVAVLRMEVGRTPGDPALVRLVRELSLKDDDFRTWWEAHEVRSGRKLERAYRHPAVGELTLDVQQFSVQTHPDQLLVVYTASPGTGSAAKLNQVLENA